MIYKFVSRVVGFNKFPITRHACIPRRVSKLPHNQRGIPHT